MNRSRILVNLARHGNPEPRTINNDSEEEADTHKTSHLGQELKSSQLSKHNNDGNSSDLDEIQMDIVSEMENFIDRSAVFSSGPSTSNQEISLDMETFRELDDDDHLYGSDYSDLDPDYTETNDKTNGERKGIDSGSGWSSDSDDDSSDTENIHSNISNIEMVTLILEDVLQRVWLSVRPSKRRRKANPAEWKRNINKKRKADGLTYTSKGKVQPAKIPKPVDCGKCKFKCTEFFSEDDRQKLCRHFYSLDFKNKKNFILSCITVQEIKTRKVQRATEKKERSFSKKCYFSKNSEKIQVCQKFFTSTLCISVDVISDAIEKTDSLGIYNSEDKRGKKAPPNKTKEDDVQFVRDHIESFPLIESHYCRKDTKKKYLPADLKSVSNMYRLYMEKCDELQRTPVSEFKYRSIFCEEYNISFFKPKKDLCNVCCKYDKAEGNAKADLEVEYQEHINRKNVSSLAKEADKVRCNNDENFMSISMDLQAVLQIPSSGESLLYYMRKLVLYNFTIYEAGLPNVAYCLCWSEINGKKGSCEIGTCLYYYLSECLPTNITQLTMFSDTCGGQNRNRNIAALLLWAVQNHAHLETIEQKFLESGHTHMEVDSMHAAIENAAKNTSLNSVSDWKHIFKQARRKQTKQVNLEEGKRKYVIENYKIKEFKYHEMKDLTKLADSLLKSKNKDNNNEQVKWLKIKRIKYTKGEKYKIFFNYDMSEDFLFMDLSPSNTTTSTPKTRRRAQSNPPSIAQNEYPAEIESLYDCPLPISIAKKKDLEKMCRKGIIPEEYHPWIHALKTVNTVEPTYCDSCDSE